MEIPQFFIIPGLGNSGPEHWQTYFEKSGRNFHRIEQSEWDEPVCNNWINTIDRTITTCDLSSVILIGHSLGCTAIAHWASCFNRKIRAALLVAPSDIENPRYTFPAKGFNPVPLERLGFNTIVVASDDDPWVSPERARFFADCWGSTFISIGNAGHINAASGYGRWEEGLKILYTLG